MTAISYIASVVKRVFNPNGSIDVAIQDQFTPAVDVLMSQKIKTDITLTADGAVGDETIDVSAGHGFAANSWIEIYEGVRTYQAQVKSVSTNELTLFLPLSFAYTIAGATVYRVNVDLNTVDGSGTPVEFSFIAFPGAEIDYDVYGAVVSIADSVAMDGGTFAGQTALTNGIPMYVTSTVYTGNLVNMKRNQDLIERSSDFAFNDKGPSGDFMLIIKKMFSGGQGLNGVAVRLFGEFNSKVVALVRDDLAALATISVFRIAIVGHTVD